MQHGLSIEEENLQKFSELFDEYATHNSDKIEEVIDVDMEIKKEDLNVQLLKDIYAIRPFGQSNNAPLFLYNNLKIHAIRTLKDEKHLKFTLKDDRVLVEALAFGKGDRRDEFKLQDKIDVLCSVELNTYTTPKTIQLMLTDFKKSINQ